MNLVCTRRQAIEEGEQLPAHIGELAEVTRSLYYYPVFMTRAVYELIEDAIASGQADFLGVWHDILFMSRFYRREIDRSTVRFLVEIPNERGKQITHELIAKCGPTDIDDPSPCITIMTREDY